MQKCKLAVIIKCISYLWEEKLELSCENAWRFFSSSSKLQREQHNAWTWGLHHSKAYLPDMFPGSLNGCVIAL